MKRPAAKRKAGKGATAKGTTATRVARPLTGWLVVASSVTLAVAVVLVSRAVQRPAAPPPAPDALMSLSPGAAYDSALKVSFKGLALESLPYYRRALRGVRADFWQLHCNYSSALYNGTLEQTVRRGVRMPLVRSNWERMALLRESLLEMNLAGPLAHSPADRATLHTLRGQLTQVYGFPWETLVWFRGAQFADPSQPELASRADRYQWSLEHPTAPNAVTAPEPGPTTSP